jgi:hypothetical protein
MKLFFLVRIATFGVLAFAAAAVLRADYDIQVTGSNTGSVWGSGPYTDDSNIGTAAVHAGLISVGQSATIRVIARGTDSYFPGSTQNGVTTYGWFSSWGAIDLELVSGSGGGGGGGATNTPASVSLNAPSTLTVGQLFTVTASASDPDANLSEMCVRWQGIGVVDYWNDLSGSSSSRSTTLTAPSAPGTFNLRAEALDSLGEGSDSGWQTITVIAAPANRPPDVSISAPSSVATNQGYSVSVDASDLDGNLDTLSIRRQGTGLIAPSPGWWTTESSEGYNASRSVTDSSPSVATTLYYRGEAWDKSSAGVAGDWQATNVYASSSPSVSISPSTVAPNGTITIDYSDAPDGSTWVGFFRPGDSDYNYLDYCYVDQGSGSIQFILYPRFEPGQTYEARMFASGGYDRIATSGTFTVSAIVPVITSSSTASAVRGSSFSYTITAAYLPTSFNATNLPPGLGFDPGNAVISGTPTTEGTFSVFLSASNAAGTAAQTLTLTVSAPPPVITSASYASGTYGSPFNYQITATNSPTGYGVGGLAPGLNYNSSTGLISGTPSYPGPYTIYLSATNSGGTGTGVLNVTINKASQSPLVAIAGTSPSIPAAQTISASVTVGQSITFSTSGGAGGGAYVWGGDASGTGSTKTVMFNTVGTRTVSVCRAGDTYHNLSNTAAATITVINVPPPVITSPNTANGIYGTPVEYRIEATNSPTSFSATGLPPGLSVNVSSGVISGAPMATGTFNVALGATSGAGQGTALLVLTIGKATPVGTFPRPELVNPSTIPVVITQEMLRATFAHPSNPALTPAGQPTYAIVDGSAQLGNPVGQKIYYNSVPIRVEATYPGDSNYTSATVSAWFVIDDTRPPSVPTGLHSVLIGTQSITLAWEPSSDNWQVDHYEVSVSGGNISDRRVSTADATFSEIVNDLTPGTLYTIKVRAWDPDRTVFRGLGANASPWSPEIAIATRSSPASDSSIWGDVDGDGIKDEIIPAGSSRFAIAVDNWFTHEPAATYSTFEPNTWFTQTPVWVPGGGEVEGTFIWVWKPITVWEEMQHVAEWIDVYVVAFCTMEPGYSYGIYRADRGGSWALETNIIPEQGTNETESVQLGSQGVMFATQFYGASYYLVRRSLPPSGVVLSLPGGIGTVKIGAGGAASGTLTLPELGGLKISVTSNAATISINGSSVTVSGGSVSGSITLPGGYSISAVSNGNVTLSGLPGGASITAGPGGTSITLPNGPTISVSSTGAISMSVPAGANAVLNDALDLLGRVLGIGPNSQNVRAAVVPAGPYPIVWGQASGINLGGRAPGIYSVGITNDERPIPEIQHVIWITVTVGSPPPPRIAVDANRDGAIAFDASDATSSQVPYRFWLNDDDDGFPQDEDDHVSSTRKDYEDLVITSRRDLEDFARIHVYLGGLEDAVTNGQIFVGLKWKSTTGAPAINIYKAVEADGGTKYLTDLATASQQAAALHVVRNKDGAYTSVDTSGTFVFNPDFWSGLNASGGKKYLIFEGAGIGSGQLEIVLLKPDGTEIGEGLGVWFDLKSIKSLYQRVKVTPRDPNGIQAPFMAGNFDANGSGSETSDDGYPFVAPADEAKTALVFVHGSNISYETSKSHAETMFKRLWWRGYKGRLVLFYWDTLVGPWDGTVPAHYNLNEYRALKYGWALKNYVETGLPADYAHNVIGHSMGNAVIASALRAREAVNGSTIPGMTARNVVLMNAAVSASSFQSGAATLPELASLENPQTTPDTIGQLGYRGMAETGINATLFSVYNINDYALGWWVTNQRNRKPEDLRNPFSSYGTITTYPRQYTWTTTGGGQLWDWSNFSSGPVRIRYVDDISESMAFIARSRTAATGRMNVGGSVSDDFNVGEGSTQMPDQFGDIREDHSGAFTRKIQQLTPLYQYIFEKAR